MGDKKYKENKGAYKEERTVNKYGRIADYKHTTNGKSHHHAVVRNVFGFPGPGKKK